MKNLLDGMNWKFPMLLMKLVGVGLVSDYQRGRSFSPAGCRLANVTGIGWHEMIGPLRSPSRISQNLGKTRMFSLLTSPRNLLRSTAKSRTTLSLSSKSSTMQSMLKSGLERRKDPSNQHHLLSNKDTTLSTRKSTLEQTGLATKKAGGKLEEWIPNILGSICATLANETLGLRTGSIKFKARPMHPHTRFDLQQKWSTHHPVATRAMLLQLDYVLYIFMYVRSFGNTHPYY